MTKPQLLIRGAQEAANALDKMRAPTISQEQCKAILSHLRGAAAAIQTLERLLAGCEPPKTSR